MFRLMHAMLATELLHVKLFLILEGTIKHHSFEFDLINNFLFIIPSVTLTLTSSKKMDSSIFTMCLRILANTIWI